MNSEPALQRAWGGEPGQRDVWPTRRQMLLLQAALLPDGRAGDAWRRIRPEIDIATLDGSTTALLPTLRRNLIAQGIDDQLLTLFKGVHRYTWARSQTLMGAVLPALRELEAQGVPTMLLKGAAFIAKGQVDAGQRSINDVDVLVPTARLADAVAVLTRCGLAPVGDASSWYVTDYAPAFTPSYGFADEHDRQLDLHWHVLHGSCQPDADADFWAAARPVELLGVKTRALAPTDELLHVIVHGLRWNPLPTYRWVVDAALLASGAFGPVDYGRLVAQGVKRRLCVPLHAGLTYLRQTVEAPVPIEALRELRKTQSRLERFTFRAEMTQPRQRRWSQQAVIYHEQYLRRELDLGQPATPGRRLHAEWRRLGMRHPLDLGCVRSGGVPGPGRPASEAEAPLGRGDLTAPAVLRPGNRVAFDDSEVLRRHVAYGTWRAESSGCWMAGRESRLVFGLDASPGTRLALTLGAETRLRRQEATVIANGRRAGRLAYEPGHGLLEQSILLPAETAAADRLDLRLRCRSVSCPAAEGVDDEERRFGLFLRDLVLLAPAVYPLDRRIECAGGGAATEDGPSPWLFLSGWYPPEPAGRWTHGKTAMVYVRLPEAAPAVDLEFEAAPFVLAEHAPLRFAVSAGRQRLGKFLWRDPSPRHVRLRIPQSAPDPDGGLLLTWKIGNPHSPSERGEPDIRALGLMLSSLAVVQRSYGTG